MPLIEVVGNVKEDGTLDVQLPAGTPIGRANVTIWIESAEDAEDEARWEEAFSKSEDMLTRMALKALAEDAAGLATEFDPDVDLDEPKP